MGVPTTPTEPAVVCVSCGRSKDREPREDAGGKYGCDTPEWHQPQPDVPDVDVTADDGDAYAPETEEDLLAAVGPEPGKTWAELYAKAALQLSYRTAELRGAERELDRLRLGGRLVSGISDADSARLVAALVRRMRGENTEARLTYDELEAPGRLRVHIEPATGALVLTVEDP